MNELLSRLMVLFVVAMCARMALAEQQAAGSRGRAEAARQAHNLEVVGSNPTPATSKVEEKLRELLPPGRLGVIKRKELRRFRQAQDRKWSNWLEAVSR